MFEKRKLSSIAYRLNIGCEKAYTVEKSLIRIERMPIMNNVFIIRWYRVVVLMVKSSKMFLVFHEKRVRIFKAFR